MFQTDTFDGIAAYLETLFLCHWSAVGSSIALTRHLFNQLLHTTLSTISAFPTTDHCNCVDVSKCYLACTDRARDVPKHISVQGRFNENNPHNYNFYKTFA